MERIMLPQKELTHGVKETLEIVHLGTEDYYFHTPQSIELYASITGAPAKELSSIVCFYDQINTEDIPMVAREVDITGAIEKACGDSVHFEDWTSSRILRKKRMIKIRRCDGKKGSLKPDFFVVLKEKGKKCVVVFDCVPPVYGAFTTGEKREKYVEYLLAYHSWLSSPDKVETWAKKVKADVPAEAIGVAIILPDKESGMAEELLEELQKREIDTPIFLAMKDFLSNPLSSWYTNCSPQRKKKIFLQTQKTGKKDAR
jgi:hypothetical protein